MPRVDAAEEGPRGEMPCRFIDLAGSDFFVKMAGRTWVSSSTWPRSEGLLEAVKFTSQKSTPETRSTKAMSSVNASVRL
jgi:hypothetical protein